MTLREEADAAGRFIALFDFAVPFALALAAEGAADGFFIAGGAFEDDDGPGTASSADGSGEAFAFGVPSEDIDAALLAFGFGSVVAFGVAFEAAAFEAAAFEAAAFGRAATTIGLSSSSSESVVISCLLSDDISS